MPPAARAPRPGHRPQPGPRPAGAGGRRQRRRAGHGVAPRRGQGLALALAVPAAADNGRQGGGGWLHEGAQHGGVGADAQVRDIGRDRVTRLQVFHYINLVPNVVKRQHSGHTWHSLKILPSPLPPAPPSLPWT